MEDTGPDVAVVPTVVGLPQTTAEPRIRAAGFVARADRRRSGRAVGFVLRQRPLPGAVRVRGSTVRISVSAGP
jgi:beta-lactam-binding protein with PASTA domain